MKKPISKQQIRSEIEKQIVDFLKQGGSVSQIERGISGRLNPDGPLKPESGNFQQPKTERTYLPEVVAALDERKKAKPVKSKSIKKKPKKKIIYDDFGEPLRWEWVE